MDEKERSLKRVPINRGITAGNIIKAYVEKSQHQQRRIDRIGRHDRNRWRRMMKIVPADA